MNILSRFKIHVLRFPEIIQFSKFALVGATSAVVDFALYTLLRYFLCKHFLTYATNPDARNLIFISANIVSVFCAMITNFLINKYWTFQSKDHTLLVTQSARFFIVAGTGYLFNQLIVYLLLTFTQIEYLLWSHGDFLAKVVAVFIVMFWNWFGSKYWTFKTI